ncbi:MAG: MarR family transcriptional regulator [Bacteroidetes bacterium]|jgi:MarR family 2-MHQ and catechol resistance regulon transcriptional repressor|nr:MarR family transcriptional regulator [Bacteroidota bacterium]
MPTHYKGSPREIETLNAFIKLSRASNTLHNYLSRKLAECDITESQFGVLEALYHLGPLNQKALGDKILKSGGNITMVVMNLEKQGWVQKDKDPTDLRSHIIRLTPAGEDFIATIFPNHIERVVELFSELSNEELATFGDLCKKIGLKAAQSS